MAAQPAAVLQSVGRVAQMAAQGSDHRAVGRRGRAGGAAKKRRVGAGGHLLGKPRFADPGVAPEQHQRPMPRDRFGCGLLQPGALGFPADHPSRVHALSLIRAEYGIAPCNYGSSADVHDTCAPYGGCMNLYTIRRRDFWDSAEALQQSANRSTEAGDEMSDDIRWIRTYVVQEESGRLGTLCVYEGSSAEKVREHAERAGMPADEVTLVTDTVIVRPDPVAAAR
jgi:Protein of unknown function (DUF4242)